MKLKKSYALGITFLAFMYDKDVQMLEFILSYESHGVYPQIFLL